MTTTVTRKGQVTIPQRVRERLGIAPGDRVAFEVTQDGGALLTKADSEIKPSRFERVRGRLGKGMSTDEIMALLRD